MTAEHNIEKVIVDEAVRIWTRHPRHADRTPHAGDVDLNLNWTGQSWYARVVCLPPRTRGRFVGEYGRRPVEALAHLLGTLSKM